MFFPVGEAMILGINRKQFMIKSFHRNNKNYGFVGEGALLRALKTLKCKGFCFAKKQKDDLVHVTLKITARRKISSFSRFGRFVSGLLLAFLLTFRGHMCYFHHVLRGAELRTIVLGYFVYITRNTISRVSMCSKLYHMNYQALRKSFFGLKIQAKRAKLFHN